MPPLPTPAKMADELLNGSTATEQTLDHFSETQGLRVLSLMKTAPAELLVEMWTTRARIVRQAALMAKERGMASETGAFEMTPELTLEAYQALFPPVETPEANVMTIDQRRRMLAWLESLAPEPAP